MRYRNILLVVNLLAIMAFVNYSALRYEIIKKNGTPVFLEIIRGDIKKPFIQGDVLNLRYNLANEMFLDTLFRHGYIVVTLDSNAIASKVRFQQFNYPKAAKEYVIEYSKNSKGIQIGPGQYFIQQGQSKKFETAKYGSLQVDASGKALLMGLYDSSLKKID